MSERKIPIYLECGYSIAMQVLGGKWKICIIEALRDKPLRPSLIFKEVPDATERVINQQLKELLEYKIIDSRSNYKFVITEFDMFFPYAKNWEFNDYLLNYSFKNLNHDAIEEIKELDDKDEKKSAYQKLYKDYQEKWHYKKYGRLKKIEEKAKEMARLDINKSLEKYISLRTEVNMIHEALMCAASDLDGAIQHAIDVARGK